MEPEITNTFILNVNDRKPSFIFIIQIYIEMIFKCLVCHAWHPPTQFLKHKLFQYHCFNGFYGTNRVQQSAGSRPRPHILDPQQHAVSGG